MTKIDIFSGFLGAGKTTLIKKLIQEAYAGEKLVLIENEFGEIGIDGGFLKESGVQINEMNSGCICCSLVGDFSAALQQVLRDFAPDRILIEPSGVGKLSDVIRAVRGADMDGAVLNGYTTVVDANKCKMYMRNFGEFFNDQVEHAGCIILSHTDTAPAEKVQDCVRRLREHNPHAEIVTTPWNDLSGTQLLAAIERRNTLADELQQMETETCPVCGHRHEHEHHHHDHEEDCGHQHAHHHGHDEHCGCGCHDHDHEHHHHADDVFTSWGVETANSYTAGELQHILESLMDTGAYGTVLRAKGIVPGQDGAWLHFDYVPGEPDVRTGAAGTTGRLCVIGADLKTDALTALFHI